MKVALIGRYGEGEIVAGPERVARELFHSLKEKNIDVTFIEYFFSGYRDYTFLNKILGQKNDVNGKFRMGIVPLILKLLKGQYDIIHFVNSQRFQIIILFLKTFLRFNIVATLHGLAEHELKNRKNYWKKRYLMDLLVEKYIIRKSDLLIFPSNLLSDVFKKKYRLHQGKFRVIPNGISNEFSYVINTTHFNKELSLIFYNAFDQSINKGLQELVDHLSLTENIKIKLFVLGYKEQVINENKNLEIIFTGLLNHDEFIHFCEDKNFIIKSGAFEPFSIIVAECMSLGLIPIITENTGIKDFVIHGYNGFIYNSKNSGSLAELLIDILLDKYDLNFVCENAKQIRNELNWGSVSEKYFEAYKSVL